MKNKETLQQALAARKEEIFGYQINIDNYRLAIPFAEADPELKEFSYQLKSLLASEILEQKKAAIILKVLQIQLGE